MAESCILTVIYQYVVVFKGESVRANEVLDVIHLHHHGAAIVHEVVLNDPNWLDTYELGTDQLGTNRRIDALMIKGKQRTAIEVKISRADYARETERKRQVWRSITHRFVYAVPAGLITPDEVPDGLGLWEIHPGDTPRLVVAKRARVNPNPDPITDQLFTAMCYRAMRNND